jgi:hypothetical protein
MRHLCSMVFFTFLCGPPSMAQEGAADIITMPKPVSISRFIPSGEERTIGFVASLFPDCTSRGRTITRVIKPPAHGVMTFANVDNFSNYNTTSRLASCNDKKSAGLNIVYKSEDGYLGDDGAVIFLLFPDGTAAEWHYVILVK